MFFMMGIYDRIREIQYSGDMQICSGCGRYCNYRIYVKYMCLSLFFIPVLKWGKQYYAESSCCGNRIELDRKTGRKIERGEKIIF